MALRPSFGPEPTITRISQGVRKKGFFPYVHDHPLDDLSVDDNSNSHDGAALHHAAAHFARLNHSDPEELLDNRRFIPQEQAWRLQTALNKISALPERFGRPRDQYLPLVSLVATSGWDRATAFCLCGVKNLAGRSQPCHQWPFCPSCSYWKRKRAALDAYLTRFQRTSWFLVTISYNVLLGDDIMDEEEVRLCWAAAHAALRDLKDAGYIRGAVVRSELHLESFLPLLYLPHGHALVDADDVDRQFLADRVFAYRCPGSDQGVRVPMSIEHRRLGSERAFANALSYVNKPLDLVTPYEQAWPRAVVDGRRLAPELNNQVDTFFDAFKVFTADAHQVRYLGTCHHAHRDTLRVPPKRRRAQQEVISAMLVDANFDQWDADVAGTEPATVFHPPGASPQPAR